MWSGEEKLEAGGDEKLIFNFIWPYPMIVTLNILVYIQRTILNFFRATIFLYSPCHLYMRAWIRVPEAPGCYERAARAERKSALQGSGLVRTVGPCAQRRVALMPRPIATARDALC